MAIDESTPITAHAYKAISDAATPGGDPHRVAITSLLGAVHALEVRQNVVIKSLKSTHSAVETALKAAQSHNNVAQAQQDALRILQESVERLSDESTPSADQD